MPKYYIYLIYTGLLALILILVVPRKEIRRLAFWGILFGAVVDAFAIILFTHLLDVGGYLNYGPLALLGMPFLPLIAWTVYYIIYFYFLPKQPPWNYIFTVTAASYSVIFSNVLSNLGIFEWNYGKIFIPFLIYISWNSLATWAYLKFIEDINIYAD
ncbi:MAG: hypothetical protein PWQ96_1095 [Clostridia bacterium]|jgi:hypothetical protein|nr:hypothetical protein [Clostridiales bacterium]MDK2985453.1 hypothetical protein [Clostridia bacterium]